MCDAIFFSLRSISVGAYVGLTTRRHAVIGGAKFNVFAVRAEELIEDRPEFIRSGRATAQGTPSSLMPQARSSPHAYAGLEGIVKAGDRGRAIARDLDYPR